LHRNIRESFNTLDRWVVKLCNWKWNVDNKVVLLTVVENSGIGKFSRSYFIEFEHFIKITWNYVISTYTCNFLQYILNSILCFTNIYSPFNSQFFSQLIKEQYNYRFSSFYCSLSQIETTRHVTRLILTPWQMYS
jgi:hypothetical protein